MGDTGGEYACPCACIFVSEDESVEVANVRAREGGGARRGGGRRGRVGRGCVGVGCRVLDGVDQEVEDVVHDFFMSDQR